MTGCERGIESIGDSEADISEVGESCSLIGSPPQCVGQLVVVPGLHDNVGWRLGVIILFIIGLSLWQRLRPPLEKIVVIKPTHRADGRDVCYGLIGRGRGRGHTHGCMCLQYSPCVYIWNVNNY